MKCRNLSPSDVSILLSRKHEDLIRHIDMLLTDLNRAQRKRDEVRAEFASWTPIHSFFTQIIDKLRIDFKYRVRHELKREARSLVNRAMADGRKRRKRK